MKHSFTIVRASQKEGFVDVRKDTLENNIFIVFYEAHFYSFFFLKTGCLRKRVFWILEKS